MAIIKAKTGVTLSKCAVTSAFLFVMVLCIPKLGKSALILDLSPDVQTGAPGSNVQFSGVLTNGSATDTVYLNGVSVLLPYAFLEPDASDFFASPPSLAPFESYAGIFLTVGIDNSAPQGDFSGQLQILGGSDPSALNLIASGSFVVETAAVPEPTFTLLTFAMLFVALLAREHRGDLTIRARLAKSLSL